MIGTIVDPAIIMNTMAPHNVPPLGCKGPPSLPAKERKYTEEAIVMKVPTQTTFNVRVYFLVLSRMTPVDIADIVPNRTINIAMSAI